ncbi:malonate decarboxylase holo-ACP synthase [Lactobacillus sp. ESL0731]|uniref:malonate decarboxylase holo-ACP synthase n=1 Tax=unclassified Lactobacillus TaxID=2620435 RepID=UPI0023F9C7E3|nr:MULTISPECIES: malonate decarboxylase holo-ACP synthase [unclassified Lactobacillus]WEV50511.1 malonate decarboxylase holo-ACP synthase [Lactobacillus sp. ESL0700]WEV61641.1 malonate decarboxylase holo-ACP synthase [Lactobacillus sp. ESL0731]
MALIPPHTLIELADVAPLIQQPLPSWAQKVLTQAPYVIVRRGKQGTQIPVGIRGFTKNQRFASFLPRNKWRKLISPQQALTYLPKLAQERAQLPAFTKLQKIMPLLDNYDWGVSGSLQFELVTGLPVVSLTSDIDVILTNMRPLSHQEARALIERLQAIYPAVHVDIQVVSGQNGFSLEEFAQQRAMTILLKTATGPKLVSDPWQF